MPDYARLSIAGFTPQHQTLPRFRPAAQVTLTLANSGDEPVPVRLTASAEKRRGQFEFWLPAEATPLAGQATLSLAAGEKQSILITILPPPRPLAGLKNSTFRYTLNCAILSAPYQNQTLLGQIAVKPWFGPWLLSLATGLTVALLAYLWAALAGDSGPGQPVQIEQEQAQPATQPALPGFHTFAEVDAPALPSPGQPAAAPLAYEDMFKAAAAQHNLDWRVLAELAYQESRLNPQAIGRDNDMGLMQVIPTTWARWAPQVGVSDPFDPYSNIQVGAAYLAHARDIARAHGYTEDYWMLIGYNWGTTNLDRLLAENGTWATVPAKQQFYALKILQSAANPVPRWQNSTP